MKTSGRLLSSLLLALLGLGTGCGLGTEIGNGKKPKSDKSPTPAANDDGGTEGADDDSVNAENGEIDGVSSPNTGDPDTGEAVDGASDMGGTPQAVRGDEENRGFDFDLAALAANCGSAFAVVDSDKGAEVLLRRTDAEATDPAAELRARLESGAWILATNKDLFEIRPQTATNPYGVTSTRVDDTGPVHPYTCGKPSITASTTISGKTGTFRRVSVELDGPGGPHRVAWYTRSGGTNRELLVRITVDLEGGADSKTIVLDVAE